MCPSCQELHETLNWGGLFHTISPFSLPLVGRSLSKSTDKPVKLRCNTNECDPSWFKTTIYDENAIMHTYSRSPLKCNFQNYTCKSYLEALFLAHISSTFKGDLQKDTCKSYLEALFLTHVGSPLKGNFSIVVRISPNQRHYLSFTSAALSKVIS